MNEKLLQYLWNFKLFSPLDFLDTDGNPIQILDFGEWNQNSGPDFLNGKIRYKNLIFSGHIELHLKSSDWIFHGHEDNPDYQNIILHVVYRHDAEPEYFSQNQIPTLCLAPYINRKTIDYYAKLSGVSQFIPCESFLEVEKIPFGFSEALLFKKLDEKATEIGRILSQNKNDLEATLVAQMAYAFGLKINATIFREIVENIGFGILQKVRQNLFQTEALLFGKSGLLEKPTDDYGQKLLKEYLFLKTKFGLSETFIRPKFLRLHPPNFPTIRLSQLAALLHKIPKIFSAVTQASSTKEMYGIFEMIEASDYWNHHYTFGKTSEKPHKKRLSDDFIFKILINSVLPFRYFYFKNANINATDDILTFYTQIRAEENTILKNWKKLGVPIKTSTDSQAYLYQYKNFCTEKKCLNCGIGYQILKNKPL